MNGTTYLMYHELQRPGRELCLQDRGYAIYVVAETDFREQMTWLKASGFGCLSVGEALSADVRRNHVALTVDDGTETDWLITAPILRELAFGATFYVAAGFIGRRGYLSPSQLRELADWGFEIGCHSMTHAFLSDLNPEQLQVQIVQAKDRLEQLIGRTVGHFSCPGGRCNRRVIEAVKTAGFRSLATSQIGANSPRSDPFRLKRVAVLRNTSLTDFEHLCQGRGLLPREVRSALLRAGKLFLGNAVYEKFRSRVLGDG